MFDRDSYLKELELQKIAERTRDRSTINTIYGKDHAERMIATEEHYQKLKFDKQFRGYIFVTFNPKAGEEPTILWNKFTDVLSAAPTTLVIATPEFRVPKQPTETGFHAHALIKTESYDSNYVYRKIKKPLMGYCGSTKHIDVRYPEAADVEKCVNYIVKHHVAPSKRAAADRTLELRIEHALPACWIEGDFTCLSPEIISVLNNYLPNPIPIEDAPPNEHSSQLQEEDASKGKEDAP